MDLKPASQEKLWQAVRSVDPPTGAKARVLSRLEAELAPAPRRRLSTVPRLVVVSVLVAGSTVAAVGLQTWRASRADVAPVESPAQPRSPLPRRAPPPTAVAPAAEREAPVSPPAIVEDQAMSEVRRADPQPHKARATKQEGTPEKVEPAAPADSPAPAPPGAKAAAESTALSQQVAMYRSISAMTDRSAALQAWRGMLEKWPSSTLRHEIELNIIDTLLRLGRRDEARSAAAAFLRHFPKSPRAAEMETLVARSE